MRRAFTCLLGTLLGLTAAAEDGTRQTVTIGGTTVGKTVRHISFEGDNATLTFDDNSSQTAEMTLVSIAFQHPTALPVVRTDEAKGQKVYNLQGQYVGDGTRQLPKGIYVVRGRKVVIK